MKDSDIQRIQHIKEYCQRITQSIKRFGNQYEIFERDVDFFQSVSMSMMQIGEHSKDLSSSFKESTEDQIQWHAIRGMRNIYAHDYKAMDKAIIWETAIHDVPTLLKFCNKVLEQNREKESQPPKKKPSILGKMEQCKKTVSEQSDKPGKNKTNDQEIE